MNHNYTSIDKLYKNGLGDYTEAPPPDVWESLDKRLDKRRKRYPFPFFWWCMAGLMLLLVGGGAYTYFNNLSIQNTELTTTTPSTVPATVAVGNAMPSVPVVATDANNGNVQEKISPAPHKPTVSATTKAEQKDNVNDDPLSNSLEEAEEVAPHPIAKANNYDALYEDAEASTNVTVLNSGTHNNISYAETEEAYTPNFADNQEENHTYGYAKPKVTPHKAQPTTTPAIAKHQTTIHHKTNKPHHTAAKAVAHKKQTTKPTPIAFAAKTNPTKVATKTNPIAVAAKANPTKVATKPNPISVAAKTNPTKVATKLTPIAVAAQPNPTKVATKPNPIAVAAKANPTKVATKPNPIAVAAKANPTKVTTKPTPIAVAAKANPTKVATKPNPIAVAAKANPTKVATKPTPIAVAAKSNPTKVATKPTPIAVAAQKNNPIKVATKPTDAPVTAAATRLQVAAAKVAPKQPAKATAVASKPTTVAIAKPKATAKHRKGNKSNGDDDNIEEVIAQAAPKQTLSPVHSLNELVQIWATYPAKANFTMKKANKLPLPEKEQEHVAKKLNLLQHFEIGIKAGFEHNNMTNRLVIAPYFERKISNKLSIIVQPALKLSFLKRQNIGDPETTYDIDHSKDKIHYDSTMVLVMPTKDTMWRRDFHFEQTHDSLRNQRYVGGAYTEIEIPLMLKYAVNNRLSVYGGINVLYSRLIRIKTATEYLGSSTLVNNNLFSFTGVPDPTIAQAFQYSGKSQAEYQYPEQPQNMLRLGYMLGVSYEINRRWKLDATLQQSSAPTNYQWGTNVNRSLALPNVRMTIGYRLGK